MSLDKTDSGVVVRGFKLRFWGSDTIVQGFRVSCGFRLQTNYVRFNALVAQVLLLSGMRMSRCPCRPLYEAATAAAAITPPLSPKISACAGA